MKLFILSTFLLFTTSRLLGSQSIYGKIDGQLGNQMFRVAAVCSHAWDHGATPCFPDLTTNRRVGIPTNYRHLFFRCNAAVPKSRKPFRWKQPREFHFSYIPIPYRSNMEIRGMFQNERYFAHNRDQILNLFSPGEEDLVYIKEKYKELLEHPLTVGIQIRNFGIVEDKQAWVWGVQYGYDYFQKAMALFPDDSLFVVSTNDLEFARQNVPTENKNIIFLENEPYYIELFLLSMLKHAIISNSSFGWWAAWLNQNPDKIVVAPKYWIDPDPQFLRGAMEVWPEEWIQIDAKWAKPNSDLSQFR